MKTGRNQPCPCGSGKKYKKCCLKSGEASGKIIDHAEYAQHRLRRTEGELVDMLVGHYTEQLGEEGFRAAFNEFLLWGAIKLDQQMIVEMESAFVIWFLFSWNPTDFLEGSNAPKDPENEGTSLALLYMEQYPEKFNDFQRQYIKEATSQHYSFFQIMAVVPGKKMTLRDLLLKRTVTVIEQQGAQENLEGAILFTKVIYPEDVSVMLGNFPLLIPPNYHGMFIEFRQDLIEDNGHLTTGCLLEVEPDLRKFFLEVYEHALNPPMPEMVNTDEEPLAPVKLIYNLRCSPAEAFHSLKNLVYGMEEEALLTRAIYDDSGEIKSVSFPWQKKGNKKHPEWDSTIMGHINIDKDRMTVEVNSERRSEIIQSEINKRLENNAIFEKAVAFSMEKLLEEGREGGSETLDEMARNHDALMQIPEVRQKMLEMAEKNWKNWLDTQLPVLGDMTPRQAVADPVGRERLEGLFLQWEQEEKRGPRNDFAPDIKKLKQALGMDEGS